MWNNYKTVLVGENYFGRILERIKGGNYDSNVIEWVIYKREK